MNRLMTSAAAAALLAAPAFAQTDLTASTGGSTMYDRIVVVEDRELIEAMLATEWIGQPVYSTSIEYSSAEEVEAAEGPLVDDSDVTPGDATAMQPTSPGTTTAPGEGAGAGAPAAYNRPDWDAAETERGAGAPVASGFRPEMATVGDVEDLVVDESGQIAAVVIGVGGFLGVGQTWVTVPFDRFTVAYDGENSWIETAITQEELEQAVEVAEREGTAVREPVDVSTGGGAVATDLEPASEEVELGAERTGEALTSGVGEAAEAGVDAAETVGEGLEQAGEAVVTETREAAETVERGLGAAGGEAEDAGETIMLEAERVGEETGSEFTAAEEDAEVIELEAERVE